jgi:hypothetical protein
MPTKFPKAGKNIPWDASPKKHEPVPPPKVLCIQCLEWVDATFYNVKYSPTKDANGVNYAWCAACLAREQYQESCRIRDEQNGCELQN